MDSHELVLYFPGVIYILIQLFKETWTIYNFFNPSSGRVKLNCLRWNINRILWKFLLINLLSYLVKEK